VDVGVSLSHYLDANLALARGELRWPGVTPDARACILDPTAHVPPSATLHQVVLGAHVRVPEGARLERVVAWRNAPLPIDLRDAIVTTRGAHRA
jgi:hypothetical protein